MWIMDTQIAVYHTILSTYMHLKIFLKKKKKKATYKDVNCHIIYYN